MLCGYNVSVAFDFLQFFKQEHFKGFKCKVDEKFSAIKYRLILDKPTQATPKPTDDLNMIVIIVYVGLLLILVIFMAISR